MSICNRNKTLLSMDFKRLNPIDLSEFLIVNGQPPIDRWDLDINIEQTIEEAALTASQLYQREPILTVPVVNLYIASRINAPQQYTEEQIMNASEDEIQHFATLMGISPNRRRIINILKLNGAIPLTFDEAAGIFENSTFTYEIMTNESVDGETTEDDLHRRICRL